MIIARLNTTLTVYRIGFLEDSVTSRATARARVTEVFVVLAWHEPALREPDPHQLTPGVGLPSIACTGGAVRAIWCEFNTRLSGGGYL